MASKAARICPTCGAVIHSPQPRQRYCSVTCRASARQAVTHRLHLTVAIALVQADLLERGCHIYLPVGGRATIPLLAMRQHRVIRVVVVAVTLYRGQPRQSRTSVTHYDTLALVYPDRTIQYRGMEIT